MYRIDRMAAIVIGLLVILSSIGKAQLIQTYTAPGASVGSLWGESVNSAGDVNNDGYDDFIVGGSEDDNGGMQAGRARVYSGFDGTVIHTFLGSAPFAYLGFSVDGIGDIDADGFDDVIVSDFPPASPGVFGPGRALVISGQTGTTISTLVGDSNNDVFGYCVSGAGDVDGDGTPDMIIGAPFDDNNGFNSGSVRVVSGATMLTLYSLDGSGVNDLFGISVSGAGDVNADGFDDFIIGAPQDFPTNGAVYVHSGFDGSVLYSYFGTGFPDRFGHSVTGAGDVNGDGFDDFAFSAPGAFSIPSDTGAATICSGVDGSVISSWTGIPSSVHFGEDIDDCGDVNGDGIPDIVVAEEGLGTLASPTIYVYSGLGGAPLETHTFGLGTGSEIRASGAGDLNRDGFSDIVVGRKFAGNRGRMNALLATTLPILNYRSKQGSTALSLEWQPMNGSLSDLNGTLVGTGATPNAMGLYGVSLAPAELTVFGFPLLIAVDTVLNLIDSGMFNFDSTGAFASNTISRQHPAIAGALVHVQWFEVSPVMASSNGIRLTMEP